MSQLVYFSTGVLASIGLGLAVDRLRKDENVEYYSRSDQRTDPLIEQDEPMPDGIIYV